MKLFQQMLVATAALGLVAPVATQASDTINFDGMNDYSKSKKASNKIDSKTFINEVNEDIAILKGRIDGLEAQHNDFEAGAFSSTTTMDGKAIMWIGAVEGADEIDGTDTEAVQTGYTYTMNLNTSFTGDDNLYVRLKAGESGDVWELKPAGYHIETKNTGDAFSVDKMWYTFPIGENITAFAGPRIENYYMYITPSIYKPGALKAFKLGGNSNFGASTDVGAGFKFETENGFGFASNIVDKNADGTGLMARTSVNKWDTQIAYTTDRWHISATASNAQNWTSQQYNATAFGEDTAADSTGYAFRAYWRPEESGTAVPEISVGYDTKSFEGGTAGAADEAESYMVGLNWKDIFQADDTIGFAFTQPLKVTSIVGNGAVNEVDPLLWELYYSFKPNDSMSITPAVFGGSDSWADASDDTFGAVVTTTFKF
jgi:hypothetical protein